MNKRNFLKCAALAAAPLGLPAAASAAGLQNSFIFSDDFACLDTFVI